LIADNLKSYVEAPTRREKSQIIDDVASQVRCYGGFVKKMRGGRWLSIGHAQAREKVGHSFRDCMKLFKGKKPSTKEMIREAQNVIFSNLQLGTGASANASTFSSVNVSNQVALAASLSQEMVIPQPVIAQPDEAYEYDIDPLPVDDFSFGYPSLICDTQGNPLEWLLF
jgi:hypothetical protein